jgi:hypothetical protein
MWDRMGSKPVGLLAEDDRWYTVYFARFPIARFDSRQLRVLPLKKAKEYDEANAGEGETSPSPAPHPLKQEENEVSGMCPV